MDSEKEMTTTIRASKKALRQDVTSTLNGLSSGMIATQSHRAVATLLGREEYRDARRISVYLSMEGKEIQTTEIVRDALKRGKKVFVPYTYKVRSTASVSAKGSDGEEQKTSSAVDDGQRKSRSVMDMVSLRDWDDFVGLEKDNWGIPTPAKESIGERENCFGATDLSGGVVSVADLKSTETGLDLIVMPGVAFDSQGGRLGHGKGYYDQFLTRYHKAMHEKMPFLVGIALNEQILATPNVVPVSQSDWPLDSLIGGDGSLVSFNSTSKKA